MGTTDILERKGALNEPRQELCADEGHSNLWEMADLDDRMNKLLHPSVSQIYSNGCEEAEFCTANDTGVVVTTSPGDECPDTTNCTALVDSFLREALQNYRDRFTILRLEQEVERFMRNPKQQQLEFQPMPSSYLRLATHRVAQHYYLKSMVVDFTTPDGTRIIAQKTPESRFPTVRLADIPVNHLEEERPDGTAIKKVAIKPRPQKGLAWSGDCSGTGELAIKLYQAKSMEERKEEYNRARARIFNSGDFFGKPSEEAASLLENSQSCGRFPLGLRKVDASLVLEKSRDVTCRGVLNDEAGWICNNNSEREPAVRLKLSANKVAILRDREKDRRDPDYDRTYERYTQRFDPGFGVNLGPFSMQAIYAPMASSGTEFPQLGGHTRQLICVDSPLLHPTFPSIRGPLVDPYKCINYGSPLDSVMTPFNPGYMVPHSGSAVYFHTLQFGCPGPAMPYIHPQEHFQRTLAKPYIRHDASITHARR
eukprot:c28569_g1_i2 orf=564-2009(+)